MLRIWPKEDRIRYVELRLQECDDPKAPSRADHQIWFLKEKGNSWQEIADQHYPKHMTQSARKSAARRAYGRTEKYYTNTTLTAEAREVLECSLSGIKVVFLERQARQRAPE